MRLDGVWPYQCVPRKFQLVGRRWGGAACEPDSAGKMPTGPTAKMAVLRLGFIPKNVGRRSSPPFLFAWRPGMAAYNFCCPSVMLGDAATRLSPTEGTREHRSPTCVAKRP